MTHGSKKLGRLVLGAILAAGAGIWTPSVASADDVFIDADHNDKVNVSVSGGGAAPGTVNPAAGTTGTKSLTITGGPWDGWSLRGGVSATKGLTGYSLTLNGVTGTNMEGILGAGSITGNIIGNQLTLQNVDVSINTNGWIAGGGSSVAGSTVQNNTLTIKSGKANANAWGLVGGLARNGTTTDQNATENHLVIEGGEVAGAYVGGGFGSQNAEGNTVEISGGTVTPTSLFGGYAGDGRANGNKVTISGGTVDMSTSANGLYGGYVFGGANTTGGASDNEVLISGGTVKGGIHGGLVKKGAGSATGNKVTISGGTVDTSGCNGVFGGWTQIDATGDASDNEVLISGGTVTGDIYGGLAQNGTGSGNATGNTVTISGGTVTGYIYGGMGSNEASGNTVTISDDAIINAIDTAYIYGGTGAPIAQNNTVNILTQIAVKGLYGGIGMTTSSGNTLNVAATGVQVGADGLNSFQNLNFYLPTNMSKTDTMLTVSGTAEVDGAKVGVMAQGKLANLAKDDKVTLLHASNPLNGTVSQTTEIVVPTSIATSDKYEFKVTSDDKNIYATITKDDSGSGGGDDPVDPVNPPEDAKKSPVETKAATVTLLNAGADMLASQGFAQAANAVAIEAAEQAKTGAAEGTNGAVGAPVVRSFTPFAAFGGSSLRAESGSHVDTKGFGINVGFAKEFSNSQGKLLFGPVVEYGGGKYDSYNNDVHGDGGSHYWGFGLMARQTNHDGFYYEGSVRFGRVTSDYKSNNLIAGAQGQTTYDTSSNYWAAHLGLGKVFATGKQDSVDAYLKYFYSHQGGDTTDIKYDGRYLDTVSFDSIDSNRIRIGARYTHKINEMNSLYGGLAYQYEFGGEARAHYTQGVGAPSPSVKGSSGMLELGWQVKPNNGPVTIDLGVTGWAGKQRGGSVQLGATWSF